MDGSSNELLLRWTYFLVDTKAFICYLALAKLWCKNLSKNEPIIRIDYLLPGYSQQQNKGYPPKVFTCPFRSYFVS